jgi:hypothetical protein
MASFGAFKGNSGGNAPNENIFPNKNKKWAIALWFLGFFGFLNFHNFYLGKIKIGVVKLTLLLSCFLLRRLFIRNGININGIVFVHSGIIFALFLWNTFDLRKIITIPKQEFGAPILPEQRLAAQDISTSDADKGWKPSNPRLASNMPLSSMKRIFIFTSGDGKTVMNCPVASGTLADTAGAPINRFFGSVPCDIIAKSKVGEQVKQTASFPESAWKAMDNIDFAASSRARMGEYKTVIRTFENPNTGESGVLVLLYQK